MRKILILIAAVMTTAASCRPTPGPGPNPTPTPTPKPIGFNCLEQPELRGVVSVANAIAGKYIVVLKNKTPATIQPLMSVEGVTETRQTREGYAARLSLMALSKILADPNVLFVQEDGVKSINDTPAFRRNSALRALPIPIVKPSVVQIFEPKKAAAFPIADTTEALSVAERFDRKGMSLDAMGVSGSVVPRVDAGGEQFEMIGIHAALVPTQVMHVAPGMKRTFVGGIGVSVRYPLPSIYKQRSVSVAIAASNPLPTPRSGDSVAGIEVHTSSLPWNLDRVDQRDLPMDGAYDPGNDGAGVNIAIVDTGITKVDDFEDRLQLPCFSAHGGCQDGHGHGTHVAGTSAGKVYGIAKKAKLWASRVLDSSGSGSDSDVIRGIEWVAAQKRELGGDWVINMSLGGGDSPALNRAVCEALASGISMAVAAGNESQNADTSSPARVQQAITVGASDRADRQASFSNYGPLLDLYAPGVDICSDQPSGTPECWNGTSMATPHVTGTVALYLQRHPGSTPQEVRDGLVAGATTGHMSGLSTGSPNLLLYVRDVP